MNTATQSQALAEAEPRQQTRPRAANNTSTKAKGNATSSSSASASTASANSASFNLDLSTFLTIVQRIFLQFQQHKVMELQSPGSQVHASANDASSNQDLRAFRTIAHLALLQYQQQMSPESQASQTASWQSSERVDRQIPASTPISTPVPASSSTNTEAPSPPTTADLALTLGSGSARWALALVHAPTRGRTSARTSGRRRRHPNNISHSRADQARSRKQVKARSRKQVKARLRALRRVWEQDLPVREVTQYGDELITMNGILTAAFTNGRRAKYYFQPHGESVGMSLENGSLVDYLLQELPPQDPPNRAQ